MDLLRFGQIGGAHGLLVVAACAAGIVAVIAATMLKGRRIAWIVAVLAVIVTIWWSVAGRGKILLWELTCEGLPEPVDLFRYHCGSHGYIPGIGVALALLVAVTVLSVPSKSRQQRAAIVSAAFLMCALVLIWSAGAVYV